jgi:hypothetical protein
MTYCGTFRVGKCRKNTADLATTSQRGRAGTKLGLLREEEVKPQMDADEHR